MSQGVNRVFIMGNLGADPEYKVTQGGMGCMKLRVACSEKYMDKSGARQERTEWVNVVLWGKRAEALSKFLQKGATVFVEGSLRTTSWEDKEGNKRFKTEVNASNLVLAGSRKSSGGQEQSKSQEEDYGPPDHPPDHPPDEDIPF